MEHLTVDTVYKEFMRLSSADRKALYMRIQKEIEEKEEIVAYTTSGEPLTKREYIQQINIGLKQIENNEVLTDEELQKEIDTW